MRTLLKASVALAMALPVLSLAAKAQTVAINGLGSSALFLEAGLAASSSSSIGATCVWSTSTSNTVTATDTSTGSSITDTGNAWVAWTPSTNTSSCATADRTVKIYAYLQTDSVVGNRCLFNANGSSNTCKITYPTSAPSPAGLISASEVALPTGIATALNNSTVNVAGTDIRPEDAVFAVARALTSCGTPVATGSQYLGLGYTNGSTIQSQFSGSFNVVNFSLPSSYTVTPIGATPELVVVNGSDSSDGLANSSITNITSSALAKFLDGTYSYAEQALATPSAAGEPVTVLIREPLSGTYNTMEYNVPNTVSLQTSQDVGVNQPSDQVNCNNSGSPLDNPLNIVTASGGARKRAIGTGQELTEVLANSESLGYSFWSVANFKNFSTSNYPYVKYLTVDGIDPLYPSTHTYTGVVPLTGTDNLTDVTLANVQNGTYPIWSLIRFVSIDSTSTAYASALASATQNYVSTGSTTSRPDFITAPNLTVVRSHFIPPAGAGQPTTAANGHVGNITSSACTATEAGGDVGGVIFTLAADSTYCTTNGVTTGQTGQRR